MASIGLEKILQLLKNTQPKQKFLIGELPQSALKDLNKLNPAFRTPDTMTTTHAMESRFQKDNWQPEETARSLVELLNSGELLRGIPNKPGGGRAANEALWLPGDPVSLFAPAVPLSSGGIEVRTIFEDKFDNILRMLEKQPDRWGDGALPISSLHRNTSYGGTSSQRPRLSAVNNQPAVETTLAEIFEKVKNSKKSVLPPLALGTAATGAGLLGAPSGAEANNKVNMGLKPNLAKMLEWLDALKAGKEVNMEKIVHGPVQDNVFEILNKQEPKFSIPEYVSTPFNIQHYLDSRMGKDALSNEQIIEILKGITEGKNVFYKQGNPPFQHGVAAVSNPVSFTAALKPENGMAGIYQANPVDTKRLLNKLRSQNNEELGVQHIPFNLTLEDNPNSLFSLQARFSADSSSLEKRIRELGQNVKKDPKSLLPPLTLGTGAAGAGLLGAPSGAEASHGHTWSMQPNSRELQEILSVVRSLGAGIKQPQRYAQDWSEFEREWANGNFHINEPGLREPLWSPADLPAAFAGGAIGAAAKPILAGLGAALMDAPATIGLGWGIENMERGFELLQHLPKGFSYNWGNQ